MIEEFKKIHDQLESEIESDGREICKLQQRMRANRKRLRHAYHFLNSTKMIPGFNLLDECERILRASSEPMHVTILMQRLSDDGIPIPGRGDVANVIGRLRLSPKRFKRIGRGTYNVV
jgi:hypothetical protein